MFNKKKFDRTNGEVRVCRVCNEGFHTMKPVNRCNVCTNEWAKERLKEKIELGLVEAIPYKENYPFNTDNGEAVKRFSNIQKELKKCETKEERRAHFAKQLEEIERLGILEWINDRRDAETKREKFNRRKSKKDIHHMTWDEFEAGGWGEPEDS